MAAQKITYGDKTDGVSSATSADFNEIKAVVNTNSDVLSDTGDNVSSVTPSYESVSTTPVTVGVSGFNHTVYSQTGSVSGVIELTISDAANTNDRITVVSVGTYDTNVALTGLTGEIVPGGEARSYLWSGSAWYLASGGGSGSGGGVGATAIGGVYWYATRTGAVPTGALKCDGSTKLIADYPTLYAIIGTNFGGDGSTTFAVPGPADGIVYENQTSGSVEVESVGQWVIQAESHESTSSDFTSMYGVYELPPYGEALVEGELFLDGSENYVSSANRKPVVDAVEYVPAIKYIDSIPYDAVESKWPGKRGTYGIFGDYTNVISGLGTPNNCTRVDEGSWYKITATATSAAYNTHTFTALTNNGHIAVKVRKGNALKAVITTTAHYATITWATQTIAFSGTAVDAGSEWISDDIVILRMDRGTTGATLIRTYSGDLTTAVGDYTYYQDLMVVDLDYPVPYTPGTHVVNKLQYNVDWATSSEWTIEGWFYFSNSGTSKRFIDIRGGNTDPEALIISSLTTNVGDITFVTGSSAFSYTINNFTHSQWMYLKVVIKDGIGVDIYVDNNAVQSFPYTSVDLSKYAKAIHFGNTPDLDRAAQGYIQDIRILDSSDTSTDHYTNEIPYFNPEKLYGKAAGFSLDKFGNGLSNAGRIIEEYTLDGQHVTKWDTGRMDISGDFTKTVNISSTWGSLYTSSTYSPEIIFVIPFSSIPKVSVFPAVTSGAYTYGWMVAADSFASPRISKTSFTIGMTRATSSTSAAVSGQFVSIGKWK